MNAKKTQIYFFNIGLGHLDGHVGILNKISGKSGEEIYGCDHHEFGCTCDFCTEKKPLSKEAK